MQKFFFDDVMSEKFELFRVILVNIYVINQDNSGNNCIKFNEISISYNEFTILKK